MDFNSILTFQKKENYYDVLGCDELSSTEQISCEFKHRSLSCHPDKNAGDPTAVLRFKELVKAKEILVNPETRAIYDKWFKSGLTMPFEQFLNLNKSCHTSIHWACKKQKEPMLKYASNEELTSPTKDFSLSKECEKMPRTKFVWERDAGNEMLRRFRNYEV